MRLSRSTTRALAAPVVATALVLSGCATGPTATDPTAGTAGPTGATAGTTGDPAATPAVEIPDTQVGRQLRWFLAAATTPPIPEEELTAHLSEQFLAQVPPEQFNKVIQQVPGLRLQELTEVKPTSLVGLVTSGEQRIQLSISVDGEGRINGLLLSPAEQPTPSPSPASWEEVDRRLKAVAPEVGFLAAEVTPQGRCRTVHAVQSGTPRPLGSMFKLYVLGAVAERIRGGGLEWDTTLTIKPELKSLPSGELQNRPDGSTVPVHEAAKLMISISDNTGTDLLIDKVGRQAVEARNRAWSKYAERNRPFLTTRELFVLKGADYPRLARTYLDRDPRGRRDFLETTVAKTPLSEVRAWDRPRDIGTLEWFGSPDDVCRAYAGLTGLDTKPLDEVLSANDAGLGLDRATWPTVWFKGGSEPGVLTMGFLARSATGKTFVVTALTGDPRKPLDEAAAARELLALIGGSFTLLGKGS
jgi:beta-lactamase class A